VHEIQLSEEQVEALRLDRDLLQLFLSETEVEPATALWIVCINVVDGTGASTPYRCHYAGIQGCG
jgi:hypothetical protein